MKEFTPDVIVHMVKVLLIEARDTPEGDKRILGPKSPFSGLLSDMTTWCEERSLSSAYDLLVRIRINLDLGTLTAGEFATLTSDLIHRIQDDMRRAVYLRLEADEPEYFRGHKPAWGAATAVFPIMEEVAEGQKCFALGRYPSTVFHMMRILEIGLKALAVELNMSFEHKNWEAVIREIEAHVETIDKSQPATDTDKETRRQKLHFYSEACRHFRFLKDAWRNYAMHVKEAHDYATALSTLTHTSEFMKQLAAKRPWT